MSDNNNTKQKTQKINVSRQVDNSLRASGYGSRSSILEETSRGINLIGASQMSVPNRHGSGLVFFSRPCCNLTNNNIINERDFDIHRFSEEWGYARMARCALDPWNERNRIVKTKNNEMSPHGYEVVRSPLVDPRSPWLTLLTNSLMTLSGWPDIVINTHVSEKGIMGEQHIMADGHSKIYDNFRLTATFRNDNGDPVHHLIKLWVDYMSHTRLGNIFPYPEKMAARELDYMTRIYSLILDPTRTFITHYAAIGAGFPVNPGSASIHDFDVSAQMKMKEVEQKSIEFQCVGAAYNDPIILKEFNQLTGIFNPDLNLYHESMEYNVTNDLLDTIPYSVYRSKGGDKPPYVKLMPYEKQFGNFHAYPLINIYTSELEWWMKYEDWYNHVAIPMMELNNIDIKTLVQERKNDVR